MGQIDAGEVLARLNALSETHDAILAEVESARSRVRTVEALQAQLSGTNNEQEELIRMAIGCVEHGYHRPAIVMAWASVFDRVAEVLADDNYKRLRAARPRWTVSSRDELVERYPESQIVDALLDAKYVRKALHKTLQGQLHERNQAAHAGLSSPTFNMTLGYIEGTLSSLKRLETPL